MDPSRINHVKTIFFFHENIIGLLDRGRAVTLSYNFTLAFDAFSHDVLISKPGKHCLDGINTGCCTVLYWAGQEIAVLFHRGLRICIISIKGLVKEIKSMSITSGIWHHSERAANILDRNDSNKLKNSKKKSLKKVQMREWGQDLYFMVEKLNHTNGNCCRTGMTGRE